jgi:predicted RNA-binding Zn ribbon-like protein
MEIWKFVGGNVSIDFINTIGGRNDKKNQVSFISTIREDKLNNYIDLVDWAKKIGIIDQPESKRFSAAEEDPSKAQRIFNRAKLLRESLYRIFKNKIVGSVPPKDDLELLNIELKKARSYQHFVYAAENFKWEFSREVEGMEMIIFKIVMSAAELLTSGKLDKLKQCPGEACGWLFIDTSKNHSRLWCDMKDCGNFEKVRRFRKKLS